MNKLKHKRWLVSLPLLASSLLIGHSAQAMQPDSATLVAANTEQAITTDRIIVKFKSSNSPLAAAASRQFALEQLAPMSGARFQYMRRLGTGAELLSVGEKKTKADMDTILEELNARSDVEYAEPDRIMQPMYTPNDSRYSEQWHYFESTAGLNLPAAWDITTGTGAVVAVIDTGYRPHADLAGNLLPGYDMISDTAVSGDGNGRDSDASDPGDYTSANECYSGWPGSNSSWHGTHVAGTIAAVTNNGTGVAGVAFGAKVVPVRVLGHCGGYTSDIADGMIWAAGGSVSGISSNPNPADVLNLSLGGSGACDSTSQAAINTARSLGATVVVAAGNESTNASNSSPANCSGVVTVASVDRGGDRAYYSNYGSVVDIAAPGGETASAANGVLSTLNSGTTTPGSDSYAFYQGTSMATPHVAGLAALLYSVDPGITPDEVESILKSTARPFPGSCSQCGSGIVDAAAAVTLASGGGGGGGGGGDSELSNGVAETGLAASTGQELAYTLEVPAGASNLSFNISGGSGDADLYVKYGSAPTTSSYDCRPYKNGNSESCSFSTPQAGTYYVMVRAYSSFSSLSLVGSYTEGGSGGGGGSDTISESNLSGSRGTWTRYSMNVASGKSTLTVTISGGSGDADLYVRFGSAPTTSSYNCRPYKNGNNETCTFTNPSAGTWHIGLYGYSTFSGVTLQAQ